MKQKLAKLFAIERTRMIDVGSSHDGFDQRLILMCDFKLAVIYHVGDATQNLIARQSTRLVSVEKVE